MRLLWVLIAFMELSIVTIESCKMIKPCLRGSSVGPDGPYCRVVIDQLEHVSTPNHGRQVLQITAILARQQCSNKRLVLVIEMLDTVLVLVTD